MKKKITAVFTAILLIALSVVPGFAQEEKFPYVVDEAYLLTDEEATELESNAEILAGEYGLGVYIITVDDITDYVDEPDMVSAAETLYLAFELGENDDQSGILLLLSMAERDYAIFAFGYGNTAFTDYGKSYLSGKFLDDFGEDNWYDGFVDYQRTCGEMVASAQNGEPVDADNVPASPNARIYGIVACIILGVLIAFIVRGVLKGQLKSVAMGTGAEEFVTGEGLTLTARNDIYTHTTKTRVYDPPEDNSSGGTTIRDSGGSGSGGKF